RTLPPYDVHSYGPLQVRQALQPARDDFRAGIFDPHPVHDRPVRHHAEQARTVVPGLRLRRDRPDLDPSEAQPEPGRRQHIALVHPRREAQGVGKLEAPKRLAKDRIGVRNARPTRPDAQQGACQAVGGLGRQQEQQRPDQAVHGARRVACALAQSASAADNRPFVQPSTPLPGTQDLLFEGARRLRRCEATLCARFETKGYAEVIPPAIEAADVFGPEAFRALDRSGRLIALRADFTAQVARIAATRLSGMSPLRLYYRGSIVRRVAPDSGPVHERLQAGCELVGAAGAEADAEILALAAAS